MLCCTWLDQDWVAEKDLKIGPKDDCTGAEIARDMIQTIIGPKKVDSRPHLRRTHQRWAKSDTVHKG